MFIVFNSSARISPLPNLALYNIQSLTAQTYSCNVMRLNEYYLEMKLETSNHSKNTHLIIVPVIAINLLKTVV